MYLGGRSIAKGFKRMSFSTVESFTNNLPVRIDERELLQCVVAVCCCSVLLQCVVACVLVLLHHSLIICL